MTNHSIVPDQDFFSAALNKCLAKYAQQDEWAYTRLQKPSEVMRRIEIFSKICPYLNNSRSILDWGCRTGISSFMIRTYLDQYCPDLDVEIFGCDIEKVPSSFFLEESKVKYTHLTHYYKLPYGDDQFDVVFCSGVLEHVANDFESLKEVYRIVKDDGYLIITFLPNIFSYTEFISREIRREVFHNRLYTKREIRRMLLHSGFLPVALDYHQVVPSLASIDDIHKLKPLKPIFKNVFTANKYLEKIWPINCFSANIFAVAQKKAAL